MTSNGNNKFQWGRLDEVFILFLGFVFLVIMAYMNMPVAAIMAMGGTLITVVPMYVKSALERQNGNGSVPAPQILPVVIQAPPTKHHLRDE